MNSSQQLLPGFSVSSDVDFATFFTSAPMQLVTKTLENIVRNNTYESVYLFGLPGNGKSHLLQAICNLANKLGYTALYLPLRELKMYSPAEILEGVDQIDFICFDDIDDIACNELWEEAIFHLFNTRFQSKKPAFYAASFPVSQVGFLLPDLQSRLSLCLNLQIFALSDAEKTQFLEFRAQQLGLELNEQCVQFIIQRSGREVSSLIKVLDVLDEQSLIAGRKITLPFIKSVFGW